MSKEEKYQTVLPQIQALITGENDDIAKMANIAAVLHETFGFWWTGFYRVLPKAGETEETELVLGPFQGPGVRLLYPCSATMKFSLSWISIVPLSIRSMPSTAGTSNK